MATKKRYYSDKYDYASYDRRNSIEMEDSGMIREDPNAIANLPQEVMFKKYAETEGLECNLNDTIKGVDHQIKDDQSGSRKKTRKEFPEKF